ncbi:MAG: hypothetical protein ACN2B6_00325 [Rickettsiales bacterium]
MDSRTNLEPWRPGHRVIWASPAIAGMIDSGVSVNFQGLDELMPDCERNELESNAISDVMMFKSALVANRAVRKMIKGNK